MTRSPLNPSVRAFSQLLTFVLALSVLSTGEFVASTDRYSRVLNADIREACLLRGGDAGLDEKYSPIGEFLTTEDREHALEHFHIHGWRWHTASLVREARRLCTLAQRARSVESGKPFDAMTQSLHLAADYVVDFNMKGLHRIEADLMFPWMREKLTTDGAIPADASKGFANVMSQLEDDRERLVALGRSIVQSVAVATDATVDVTVRAQAVDEVVEKSALVQNCARNMMDIEDRLLVPAIAKLVPASEQHSFNNRVLRNLGIWDSRLYLVAMYDAVEESGNKQEKSLFAQAIPSIPQMMIPRWRRKLYEPRAGVLDAEL